MRILRFVLLLFMLIIGVLISLHYWSTAQFSSIKQVPIYSLVLIMSYIILHFIKKLLFNDAEWYDNLYYIALISIVLPVFFANSNNARTFHLILDLGVCFFMLPVLIEGWIIRKPQKDLLEDE
ncbi:MAG: hypothetical protein N4A41_00015 [Crocinitomicaceae bacterium]|nr:hypothetical protein [Crocinitomicaceae bacterium]